MKKGKCEQCRYVLKLTFYTIDSCDIIEKWICKKFDKLISGFVEKNKSPNIPRWCLKK